MMMRKTVLSFGLLLALAISNVTLSQAEERRLAQVVYITLSKACSCTLELCQAGNIIVDNALLKLIDYDTDRQAAVPYIGEYHLIQLPALIFLDGQKHMLWMAVGEVAKEDVAAKLSQFGG
jgi:hypothetical protein